MLHIWYWEYLKAVRRDIPLIRSINSLPSILFFNTSVLLLMLLDFLYVDHNVLGFGGSNKILVNILFECFFVIDFGCFWPCFFEGASLILVWATFVLLSLVLLSPSFFIPPLRYLFRSISVKGRLEVNQLITITTTSSARGCSAWMDEAQLSITWRDHVNKGAELWRGAQSIYLSQVGYRSLRVMCSGLERELFESTT